MILNSSFRLVVGKLQSAPGASNSNKTDQAIENGSKNCCQKLCTFCLRPPEPMEKDVPALPHVNPRPPPKQSKSIDLSHENVLMS